MSRKWRPGRTVLAKAAELHQRRMAQAILSAAPRVPHADKTQRTTRTGGTLSLQVRSRTIRKIRDSFVVIELSKLGNKLMWFVKGTRRQKPRPIPLEIDQTSLVREVEKDAVRHFTERDKEGK